ncbi:MAG: hypothetical protein FRX48_03096 [Lasallia pustulata]|uniref:ABC transporter domain-containing protein n=1 Tax=Lasallia pustulata TaxID=136370 RepID=A0A5M8PUQ5_9LECA|nr:MAG: hypothetical protein FRX48_03096 [Lasallia pustulata]
MGASGSGKTCFLDAISHRIHDSQFKTSGGISFNGNTKLSSVRSAYVVQEDALLPTLTVRETLQYAADLRLLPPFTMAERHNIVEEVILELGLKECASTRIGNDARKGCSGGEKRTTSLGVQMLANPSVLFLDEYSAISRIPNINPAEFLIDLAAVDNRLPELENISRTRVQRLKNAWQASSLLQEPEDIHDGKETVAEVTHENKSQRLESSFAREVMVQTARTLKTTIRDPMGIVGSLAEAATLGIIAGWIFLKPDGTLSGIRSREGALYTAAALQGPLASQSFVFYAVVLLCQYVSVTLAAVCVAAFRDFARASLAANLSFTLQSICSGFFIQPNRIPSYVRWIKYIAYVWYANGALVYNEFLAHTSNPERQIYDCQEPGGVDNPDCKPYTGIYIVESLGFPFNSLWKPTLTLVAFPLVFFFGSALLLKFQAAHLSISRVRPNEKDHSAKMQNVSWPHPDVRPISVTLDSYSLAIQKRSLTGRMGIKVSVLKPINTTFEPGLLNVIMGPSGSGKTSLHPPTILPVLRLIL